MFLRRVLTVVVAAPLVIGAVLCPHPWVFKSLVFVCTVIALLEAVSILIPGAERGEKAMAAVMGGLFSLWILFENGIENNFVIMVTGIIFIVLFFYMRRETNMAGVANKVSGIIFTILYVVLFASYLGLLRDRPNGAFWVFIALVATWLNDTFAYFIGKAFGRHPLAEHLSPAKTVEGFWGGLVGSAVGVTLIKWLMSDPLAIWQAALLTLLIGCLAPAGDLAESLLKRSAKVKDSGFVIPGHGGMLDRLDALLFVAPAVYYFALLVAGD